MRKILRMAVLLTTGTGLLMGCGSRDLSSIRQKVSISRTFDQRAIAPNVLQSNQKFAFEVFRTLNEEEKNKNVFISPLSIGTALTMVYQGADTETREAMEKALGYTGIDSIQIQETYANLLPYLMKIDPKVQLDIGNSIWIREGNEVKEEFLKINRKYFDAQIETIDFQEKNAADRINQWVEEATRGKIDEIINPPIHPQVLMYLLNAIYFKGEWTEQFEKKRTFDATFYLEDGSTQDVKMMKRNDEIEYGEAEDFKVVRLPYGNEKTAMYCILPPPEVSVDGFVSELNHEKWTEIKETLEKTKDVELQLPRFKFEYGTKELNAALTQMGMGHAFSEDADFSKIDHNVFISKVVHKAVIEVNEEGSEAAAVTAVAVMTGAHVEKEPTAFIADRPFVLLIVEEETDTILFMGKMMTPEP